MRALAAADDMIANRLDVFRQQQSAGAARDLADGIALLGRAKQGLLGPTLRLYRPEPTVAFGQRDARLPGFPAAALGAEAAGFAPLVRKAGGRAAAYHRGCLVVDHIEPQQDAMITAKGRFQYFGQLFEAALARLGVRAGVGEIPGEYCPGEYTVHGTADDGSRLKLVGTAQRVVAGAWLFSSVVVVEDSAPLRAVLRDCYSALGIGWDPRTAGGAGDLVPGLDVAAVEAALLAEYASRTQLAEAGNLLTPTA
jgi:octanoyl-[GcvH]:protein N-octanoyltransferase